MWPSEDTSFVIDTRALYVDLEGILPADDSRDFLRALLPQCAAYRMFVISQYGMWVNSTFREIHPVMFHHDTMIPESVVLAFGHGATS